MTPIHLRIPTSELEALDAAAEREGRTRSSMARFLIRQGLGASAPEVSYVPSPPCPCTFGADGNPDFRCTEHS